MSTTEIERVTCVRINEVLIEHLDEDWAVPCEIGRDAPDEDTIGCRGNNPAAFIVWPVSCCPRKGAPMLACKACLDEMLDDAWGIRCVWCDQAFLPSSTAFRLIEPLNRRTK